MGASGDSFRPGQQFGPYVLLQELGRGTFGVVWLANRPGAIATTQFALKFPLSDKVDKDVVTKEAQLWVRASGHPNIIPVFEASVYSNQIVIVSEYAPEGTLYNWLTRNGKKAPTIDSAMKMGDGILAGLGHLHGRDVIHRDLKPDNILLQGELPRIADFGLARVLRAIDDSKEAGGSPAYMAPEAWTGDRCVESDLWSVGVVLYECLAGQLPFMGNSCDEIRHRIICEEPPELPASVPGVMRAVVKKALAKPKEQRFHSANEMAEAWRGKVSPSGQSEVVTETPLLSQQIRLMVEDLSAESPTDRARAVRGLGQLGAGAIPAIRHLCARCDDPSPVVRTALAQALHVLLRKCSRTRPEVRAQVVAVLRDLGTPAALQCIQQLDIQ